MKSSGGGIDTALALSTLVDASNTARRNGIGAYGRMTSALVDMEKPQAVYQGFVTRPVQNSRSEPFVPLIGLLSLVVEETMVGEVGVGKDHVHHLHNIITNADARNILFIEMTTDNDLGTLARTINDTKDTTMCIIMK